MLQETVTPMLARFLSVNRSELIERCRAKVAERRAPKASSSELGHGIPLFLTQLTETLRLEHAGEQHEARALSGPAGETATTSVLAHAASQHGAELSALDFTVDQLVHDYGDLCQVITSLAIERNVPIESLEFRTLNRCLDNAIASAAQEFGYRRELMIAARESTATTERISIFAHELRSLLSTAALSVWAMKNGGAGYNSATGALLDRSLIGMRKLVDRSLTDVRPTDTLPARREAISVAGLVEDIRVVASLEARVRECGLEVPDVDLDLRVFADRELLLSAVGNLLQNAFKFTRPHTQVSLRAYAAGDRVRFDVEDRCGGLRPADAADIFLPFAQNATDRSALGRGLHICQRAVESNDGRLSVRDLAGTGCLFTIDLPRYPAPATSSRAS